MKTGMIKETRNEEQKGIYFQLSTFSRFARDADMEEKNAGRKRTAVANK
jgi:hypothetical protein